MHDSVLAPSWEFFTTLDFEWSIIRGRRPYRWTILVCSYIVASVSSRTLGTLTNSFVRCPIDLFPYTSGRPFAGNPLYCPD
jgi:hypothetical protein